MMIHNVIAKKILLACIICGVFFVSCSKPDPAKIDGSVNSLVMIKVAEPEIENKSLHRELGVHVHGAASLNVVLDSTVLAISMNIPGMDAVGFEHPAISADEQTTITQALQYFQQPNKIFILPKDADCNLIKGTVKTALLNKEEKSSTHADVDIDYEWQCKNPHELKELLIQLFLHLPHLQKIQANWISQTKQGTSELTKNNNVLVLE